MFCNSGLSTVTDHVQSHGPHSVVAPLAEETVNGVAVLPVGLPLPPPGLGHEVLGPRPGQVELLGQLVCPGPHYQGVARPLQHQPGQLYGVPHVADSGHTTAVQAPAVHQHRVHLHLALGGQHRAAAWRKA